MIDTLATAQALVEAGLEQRPAEAIARAIRDGQGYAASGDFVRAEIGALQTDMGSVRADIGSVRAEIGKLRADLTKQNNTLLRWIMGLGFGTISGILAQFIVQILQQ